MTRYRIHKAPKTAISNRQKTAREPTVSCKNGYFRPAAAQRCSTHGRYLTSTNQHGLARGPFHGRVHSRMHLDLTYDEQAAFLLKKVAKIGIIRHELAMMLRARLVR